MTKIGKRIKELRVKSRLSVDDAADLMSMTKSNLQKIERDEIDLSRENTLKFAKLFGITVEELHAPFELCDNKDTQMNKMPHPSEDQREIQTLLSFEIKMLYERIIQAKDQTIEEMQKEIDQFKYEHDFFQQEISRLKNEMRGLTTGSKVVIRKDLLFYQQHESPRGERPSEMRSEAT